MAIEQERAARVRELKEQRPDLTWGRIAEEIGLRERSVIQWQKTGGMDYENAKKFAKLMGVTTEWLWSGIELAGEKKPTGQLDRVEAKLDLILDHLGLSSATPGEVADVTEAAIPPRGDTPPRRGRSRRTPPRSAEG